MHEREPSFSGTRWDFARQAAADPTDGGGEDGGDCGPSPRRSAVPASTRRGPIVPAQHGAILTRAAHPVHRTMVRGLFPATNEAFAIDANRAAGPDGANARRAEGA